MDKKISLNLNDYIVTQEVVRARPLEDVFASRVVNGMRGNWAFWRGLRARQGDTRDAQIMLDRTTK